MKKIIIAVLLLAAFTVASMASASVDPDRQPKGATLIMDDSNGNQYVHKEERDCCKDKDKHYQEEK